MARKWLIRVGFGLVVLAVLYLVAYLWLGEVADARLTAELERIRERGEPIALEEMAPPPVPANRNAAVPLSNAAELLEDDSMEEGEAIEQFFEEPFGPDEKTVSLVSAWVERNGPALAEIEETVRRPDYHVDLDYSDVVAMELPQIPQIQMACRLVLARSLLRAREGDTRAALEDCHAALMVARLASSDPAFMLFAVRVGGERQALLCLEKILAAQDAPEEPRARLLATVEQIDVRLGFRRAILGERCFGIAAYSMVREPTLDHGDWPGWLPVPEAVLRLDEARYLEFMARAIELADRPYFEARDEWRRLREDELDPPWYGILSPLIMGVVPNVAELAASHRALLDLARIALGGTASAPDPFTGAPYDGDTAVLRSPGPDPDDESDDITWRLR